MNRHGGGVCFSVRSVCPWVMRLLLMLGWSAFRLGIWRGKARGSTWRAKCPPACQASCGLGFPAQRLVHHWVVMVGWGPSLQLWLSPRGTCRTLEAFHRANTEEWCESERRWSQNVAEKWLEIRFTVAYLHLSRLPHLRLLSVEKHRRQGHTWETARQNLTLQNHHKPNNSDPVHEYVYIFHPVTHQLGFITQTATSPSLPLTKNVQLILEIIIHFYWCPFIGNTMNAKTKPSSCFLTNNAKQRHKNEHELL